MRRSESDDVVTDGDIFQSAELLILPPKRIPQIGLSLHQSICWRAESFDKSNSSCFA